MGFSREHGGAPAEAGTTLPELLTILALIGIALSVAFTLVSPSASALDSAAAELEGFFRRARAAAIATASAYRVRPAAADRIIAEYADTCTAASWTPDEDLPLELSRGVTLADTSWSLCFSNLGVADTNLVVTLDHPDFGSTQVEVLLGGLARPAP